MLPELIPEQNSGQPIRNKQGRPMFLLPSLCGCVTQVKIIFLGKRRSSTGVLCAPILTDVSEALPVSASTDFDPFYSVYVIYLGTNDEAVA